MNNNKTVHIIGAGISGLGCAHFLKKSGISSLLFEENNQIGGKAGFRYEGDNCLEIGGKNFSSAWPLFNEIFEEFGIKEFDAQHEKPSILIQGKLVEITNKVRIPESLRLLRVIGIRSMFQLMKTLNYVKKNWRGLSYSSPLTKELEDKFDSQPITGYFDKRLTHSIFRMISIIMGGAEPEETYYSNFLNLFKDVVAGGSSYAIRDGIDRLFHKFSEPHEIHLNARVNKIIIKNSRVAQLMISKDGKDEYVPVSQVISSVPANVLRNMIEFPRDILDEIDKIRYYPVALINAVYEDDVFDEKKNSIMFDHNFHLGHCSANRAYRRNSIRLTLSGRKGRSVLNESDDHLINLAEKEFSSVLPISSRRVFYHVQRHPGGMCAYCGNFSKVKRKITDYVAGIDGLEIAGDYLEGRGMEGCLRSAKNAADTVLQTINPGDVA